MLVTTGTAARARAAGVQPPRPRRSAPARRTARRRNRSAARGHPRASFAPSQIANRPRLEHTGSGPSFVRLGRVACGVVPRGSGGQLDRRVVRSAEAALAQRRFVTAIDVLVGLGWLEPRRVDEWRQGRVPYLEAVVIASLGKISTAMKVFRHRAAARGLAPSETAYVARTRDRGRCGSRSRATRGSSGRIARTGSRPSCPNASGAVGRTSKPPARFGRRLPGQGVDVHGVRQRRGRVADHGRPRTGVPGLRRHGSLVFQPSGDAALTRRANKNSRLSAVVVRFSRARKRYERQGILVEEDALSAPSSNAWRTRSRGRGGATGTPNDAPARTSSFSRGWRSRSASCSRAARPGGPRRSPDTPRSAAAAGWDAAPPDEHSTPKRSSWRYWRGAVQDTGYDELLMSGVDRAAARDDVRDQVNAVLDHGATGKARTGTRVPTR